MLGLSVGVAVAGAVAGAGCVGDDPALGGGGTAPPPGPSDDGGGDGSKDGGGTPGACTAADSTCVGATLHACRADGSGFDDKPCALGCAPAPAHCKAPTASATGVAAADLDGAGLSSTIIAANGTLNSETGEITGGTRGANVNPDAREVIAGIAFHVAVVPNTTPAQKIGVFSFADLTVGDGRTITLTGANAVALVSAKSVVVLGILDARGACVAGAGGPGGGHGGGAALATGAGKGTVGVSNSSDQTCGGGGGAHGDNGGSSAGLGTTSAGGLPYGDATLLPFLGGSGGGRGGDANSGVANTGGLGGGGGGALHLVAGDQIVIGGGTTRGGVNAGGCGGAGAKIPAQNLSGAGGGGGSGGSILVEAPIVKLDAQAALVANGGTAGGGAAGSNASAVDGSPGAFTTNQAQGFSGGAGAGGCGAGGFGGASATAPSTVKGANGTVLGTGCAGGGGGGAGRIRINSTSGNAILVTGTALISPPFGDVSSHAEAVSTQGVLATK